MRGPCPWAGRHAAQCAALIGALLSPTYAWCPLSSPNLRAFRKDDSHYTARDTHNCIVRKKNRGGRCRPTDVIYMQAKVLIPNSR